MTREELDRLRELASKATPGPWENSRGFVRTKQGIPGNGNEYRAENFTIKTGCSWVAECRNGEAFYNPDGNANFIAAANPSVITALLDHIDSLEREARAGRELRNNMHSDEGGYFTVLRGHIEAYDTATKETDSEVP